MNRILVVDDEKSIIFALRQYFLQQGYSVDCAQSSDEALELLAAQHYALAIVDVELRGGNGAADGFHVAQFIRSHAPATAIIILTALGTPETQERARECGADSFMHKPARLSHIADVAFGLIRNVAPAAH